MADPTTKKIVDEMLASGAKRLDAGDVYETPLRTRITVVSGYAAAEGSRVVCTGAMTSHRQTNGLRPEGERPPVERAFLYPIELTGTSPPSSTVFLRPRDEVRR